MTDIMKQSYSQCKNGYEEKQNDSCYLYGVSSDFLKHALLLVEQPEGDLAKELGRALCKPRKVILREVCGL